MLGLYLGKKLVCRELGMDCDFVAKSDSEEGLMSVVAAHAKDVHGIAEITPELAAKAKSIIRDE